MARPRPGSGTNLMKPEAAARYVAITRAEAGRLLGCDLLTDPDQPETLTCPDCGGMDWVVMYGGALPGPKYKCSGCGACFSIPEGSESG